VRHRDLAARNVLKKRDGQCKVTDFGLSSVVSDTDAARMTSTTIGPVAWRAPETFRVDDAGRQIASVQTDVYMLGGLMFEVLTAGRRAPFFWLPAERLIVLRATTFINTLDSAAAAGVSIPWAIVPGDDWSGAVDGVERLKALMARCLHAEPSLRPSMDEFLAELDAIRSPSLVHDGGYASVVDGYAPVIVAPSGAATVVPRSGAASAGATASASAPAAPAAATAGVTVPASTGAASLPVDAVDMSEALAAMEALQITADVADRVCDEMIVAVAEVGHVTGVQFLQIVVDEGIRPALAVKLREKLRITSVVPPRKVRWVGGGGGGRQLGRGRESERERERERERLQQRAHR
jgi:hypothetical protein